MTASKSTTTRRPAVRHARTRLVATTAAVGLAATAIVAAGGPAAGAATPLAQSVGRFLDGSVGGNAIQSLADVKDARAVAPGSQSVQNPLDVTALNALKVPLTGALQLPGGGVFQLGAVNQVATAHTAGDALGASGAVNNNGGVALGGTNTYPADATVDLSAAALGSVPIPALPAIPGLPTGGTGSPATTLAGLGGVQAKVGAVSAVAATKTGGAFATPTYQVAGLQLVLGSPALGGLLQTLASGGQTLTGLISQLTTALNALPGGTSLGGADCSLTSGTLPTTIKLDKDPTDSSKYAVTIDPATATITVDLGVLLHVLKLDINDLPPNTDLLAYVLNNLGTILANGLSSVITGITDPLQKLGTDCLGVLPAPVQTLLGALFGALNTGQTQLTTALTSISNQLSSAGAPGIKALTDGLAQVAKIGVNVQQGAFPLSSAAAPKYKFTSALKATPNQSTSPVAGQGVVRALEIDLLGGQVAALSLANAAAGPSSAAPTSSPSPSRSTEPTTSAPTTAIPTGVPAGAGTHGGAPVLPIVLLLVVLTAIGGGVVSFRMRGSAGH